MSSVTKPQRRTQQERREATVAKLIDATIEAIGDVGYHRTTVQEICDRAGLSVGAMFRQFDGRLALVVATAHEVVRRQLATFRELVEQAGADTDALLLSLRFMRDAQSSPTVVALREMFIAARSDTDLYDRISPALAEFYREMQDEAHRSGVMSRFPEELRETVFFLVLHVFSGQAVMRGAYPRPDLDESVLELVHHLLVSVYPTPET